MDNQWSLDERNSRQILFEGIGREGLRRRRDWRGSIDRSRSRRSFVTPIRTSTRSTSPTGKCSAVVFPAAFSASNENTPGVQILHKSGHSDETIRARMKMGYMKMGRKVGFSLGLYGGYQAIDYNPQRRVYYGALESRKDGQGAGY